MPSRSPPGPRLLAFVRCTARSESQRRVRTRPRKIQRWLLRRARAGCVLAAVHQRAILGIMVFQPDFLLGTFIALLAVRPQAAGQGVGRALVEQVARATFAHRRWLYVSSDSKNLAAARFYKKLGFARIARLPDLVCENRVEILWRKGRR